MASMMVARTYGRAHVADEQHQPGQYALQDGGCVGSIALARARGKISVLGGGCTHQRGDVVGQDLGGHVDDQGLLAQPRDRFEVQPMLEPLECFFDTPALVVEIAEQRRREALSVQVGGEHADLAIGCELAHQAQPGSAGGAAPIAHVIDAWGVQRHAGLDGARAQERLGSAPAAVVVAPHDEADATRVQQRHQPGRRIAAIKHQHIVGPKQTQGLDEHAALGHELAVHAGVQGQLGAVTGNQPPFLPISRSRASPSAAAARRSAASTAAA